MSCVAIENNAEFIAHQRKAESAGVRRRQPPGAAAQAAPDQARAVKRPWTAAAIHAVHGITTHGADECGSSPARATRSMPRCCAVAGALGGGARNPRVQPQAPAGWVPETRMRTPLPPPRLGRGWSCRAAHRRRAAATPATPGRPLTNPAHDPRSTTPSDPAPSRASLLLATGGTIASAAIGHRHPDYRRPARPRPLLAAVPRLAELFPLPHRRHPDLQRRQRNL